MSIKNTTSQYGWVSISIHWLMAILIFGMFALGLWMTELGYYDTWYHKAPELHKSIGIILLLLLLFRWTWRLINPRPALMGLAWEKLVALSVHRMHYVLMFAVMLTGYLIPTAQGVGIDVFNLFTMPALISLDKTQTEFIGMSHRWLSWGMLGLAGLHAAAALKHHFIDHDTTLIRMLGIKDLKSPKKGDSL